MSRKLFVHFLPSLFDPEELRGGIAVMIDVLRASTTIVHALSAGARAVLPCEEVDEARALAANLSGGDAVLGGERDGVLIDGFDLDNSPLRYTEETVHGKTVVFTTTNGTRALIRSREAERILIGAFVNLNALVRELSAERRPVHLVCAGTRGHITAEDVLCAGAVTSALGTGGWCDDQARMSADFYQAHSRDETTLLAAVRASRGGRNLRNNGFDADVERAATRDMFDLVPEYFSETRRIEIALEQQTIGE